MEKSDNNRCTNKYKKSSNERPLLLENQSRQAEIKQQLAYFLEYIMNHHIQNSKATSDQRKFKGQLTKERLIIEAIKLFGDKGYTSTNTRSIAKAAECNVGLITFHFNGKQGLYDAAITRVKNRLNEFFHPIIATLKSCTDDENISKKELFEITIENIEQLSLNFIGMEQLVGYGLLLLRDSQDNSTIIYKTVFSPLVNALDKAIDKATSHKDPMYARLSAFMLVNASLEFLRNYPIFYSTTSNSDTLAPSIPYVVNMLTSRLLGKFEDF